MLLKKLKTNHSFNFFAFPILGLCFWLNNLLHPESNAITPGEVNSLLYLPVRSLLEGAAMLQNLIALLLILIIAIIILIIHSKYNFLRKRTMISATLFVIMAGGLTHIHSLHPVYFGAGLVILSLYRLFSAYDQPKPYSAAFDAGFLLSLATLFYYSLVVLLPALIIGIGILSRDNRWREYMVVLIGFILPLLFALSYSFFVDQLPEFLNGFEEGLLYSSKKVSVPLAIKAFLIVLGVIVFTGSYSILRAYDSMKVSTRKYFIVLFIVFISSVAAYVFLPAVSTAMLLISMIPVAFLVTNFFMFLKSELLGNVMFLMLLIVVIAAQFFS